MATLAVICRLLIAAIFLAASLSKFADISRSRHTLHEFGLPLRLANPLGTILPIVELIVGICLIFPATAWWSAVAAAVLFISFGAAISVNLFFGRKPECNCFGQVHSAPIGIKTLGWNALFLGGATLLVARGQDTYVPGITDLVASVSVTELVFAAVTTLVFTACSTTVWFLLQLYKQNGRLLERIEALEARSLPQPKNASTASSPVESSKVGLKVGTAAPDFELTMLSGARKALHDFLLPQKPLLLIFIDPGCGPCTSMLPTIAQWQNDYGDVLTVAVVSRGTRDANLRKIGSNPIANVLLQKDREISNAYQCYGTPSAVFIDHNKLIGSLIAQGSDQIATLVKSAYTKSFASLHGSLKLGSTAPNFVLKGLSGETQKFSDFKGTRLVLLFWNPSCGFCDRMLEELRSWERSHRDSVISLLVVSQGPIETNQRMGLRSPIVLDDDFLAGRVFGAGGTPSAVLIDENGVIASAVAVGSDQVFLLLGDERSVPMLEEATAADF